MTASTLLETVVPKSLRNAAHHARAHHHSSKNSDDREYSNDSNAHSIDPEQDDFEHVEREQSYDHVQHSDSHGYKDSERDSSIPSYIEEFERESEPLSPHRIAQDVSRKHLGGSTNLKIEDFDLKKTLGTGTFARVWLAKLRIGSEQDRSQVFALKVLRKADVIRLKQVEHIQHERTTLAAAAGHPFITTLVLTFRDREAVYMLLDFCPGGEIFTYLRRAGKFEEPTAKFFAAEIVLVFEFLHDMQGIAYRDLKPENILLDDRGHVKLVDFGFAKKIEKHHTYTLCGTPEYLAPEVIRNTGHGMGVDWWALGILIYEFVIGRPPFWDNNPMKIYQMIVECKLRFPPGNKLSEESKDLITRLLQPQPSHRLGCMNGGARDVKEHSWFVDIDWDAMYYKRMEGPIVPKVNNAEDSANFDSYPDEDVKQRKKYDDKMRKQWDSAFDSF